MGGEQKHFTFYQPLFIFLFKYIILSYYKDEKNNNMSAKTNMWTTLGK